MGLTAHSLAVVVIEPAEPIDVVVVGDPCTGWSMYRRRLAVDAIDLVCRLGGWSRWKMMIYRIAIVDAALYGTRAIVIGKKVALLRENWRSPIVDPFTLLN